MNLVPILFIILWIFYHFQPLRQNRHVQPFFFDSSLDGLKAEWLTLWTRFAMWASRNDKCLSRVPIVSFAWSKSLSLLSSRPLSFSLGYEILTRFVLCGVCRLCVCMPDPVNVDWLFVFAWGAWNEIWSPRGHPWWVITTRTTRNAHKKTPKSLHRIAKQMHPIKKFWVFSPDFGGRQNFCPLLFQLHLLPGLTLFSRVL